MNISRAVRALHARPIALLAALMMCASMGSVFLAGCGGGGTEGSGETPASTTGGAGGTQSDGGGNGTMAAGPVDGAKIYADRCALCHGATGHGDGPASAALNPKPRNHTDGSYMNAQSDEALRKVIHEGKGAMPPWGAVLSEEEINAVLKHIRTLAEPPYPG